MTDDSGNVTSDSGKLPKIGHDKTECAVTIIQNRRSRSNGMGGHDRAEYAQIRVIVDETLCQSDIELISVQRELFNLIVFSMNGQMFASALAGLWDVSANARFKKIG